MRALKMRMLSVALLLPLFSLSFFSTSCTRLQDDGKSQIKLSIPGEMKSNKIGALLSATDKLAHLIINISGEGMDPRVVQWDAHSSGFAAAEPPPGFTVDNLTNDRPRMVQVLAVYKDSDSQKMSFYYGDVSQMLPPGPSDLPILIKQVGQSQDVISGRVSGRYLTGANSGPTGAITIKYSPDATKPALFIERGLIVNGWFSVFMLSGAGFEYFLPDGSRLLGASGPLSLDSSYFDPTQTAKVLKATIPVHTRMEYNGNAAKVPTIDDASINVWGYWGSADVTGSKEICDDLSTGSFSDIKVYSNPPLAANSSLGYSKLSGGTAFPTNATLLATAAPLSVVNSKGGAVVASSTCGAYTTSSATDRFANFLLVNKTLLDGHGNDSLAGFRYIFRADPVTTNVLTMTVGASSTTVAGALLPDLNTKISSLKLFKRVSDLADNGHLDDPDCSVVATPGNAMGFVPTGETSTFAADGSFTATIDVTSTDLSSHSVSMVACPVLTDAGALAPIGYSTNIYSSSGGVGPAATHMSLLYGGTYMTNSTCTPITVEARTAAEAPGTVPNGTVLNLASDNPNVTFYQYSSCASAPLTSLSISGDTLGAQAQIYVNSSNSGASSATLNFNPTGLEPRGYSISLIDKPGTINMSLRTVTPSSIPAYECIPLSYETWHEAAPIAALTSWNNSYSFMPPSASGLVVYYSWDSACQSGPISMISLGNSTLSQTVFMKYTGTSNTLNLQPTSSPFTAAGGVFANGNSVPVVLPGAATQVQLELPMSFPAESCMKATLRVTDATGKTAPAPSGFSYSMSYNPALPANSGFFSDASCSSPLGSPTIAVGDTRVPIFFRWTLPGSLDITAVGGALPLSPVSATVGAPVVGAFVVTPPGVTFASGVFNGYSPLTLEGKSFPISILSLSPMGSYLTTYTDSNPANINLAATYPGLNCTSIGWSAGVGTSSCYYLDPGANYFSNAQLGFYTSNPALNVPMFNSDQRIRILRSADSTVMKDFFLSQSFGYTSAQCQPLLYARGPAGGPMLLGAQALNAWTSGSLASTSGVSGYFSDATCVSAIANVSLAVGESAKLIYVKLSGSPATGLNVNFEPLYDYANLSSVSYSANSVTTFSGYRISMTHDLAYGGCSPVMIVRADTNGNAIAAAGAENVLMTTAGLTTSWFSDANCTSNYAGDLIPFTSGDKARLVYMKTLTVSGPGNITATRQGGAETGTVSNVNVNP